MKQPPVPFALLVLLLFTAAAHAAEYGPVGGQETLYSVALKLRADKTHAGTQRALLALYRGNPSAFVDSDPNRIRPGSLLRVPDVAAMRAVNADEADQFYRELPNPRSTRPPLPASKGSDNLYIKQNINKENISSLSTPVQEAGADTVHSATRNWVREAPVSPRANSQSARAARSRTRLASLGHRVEGAAAETAGQALPAMTDTARPTMLAVMEETGDLRARPGPSHPRQTEAAPLDDPNRAAALAAVPPPRAWVTGEGMAPVPDRWRLLDSLGLTQERWYDPYHQNTLKGDKPLWGGDKFLLLSLISDLIYEPRRLPTPVGPQATTEGGATGIFGGSTQSLLNENLILALVLLKGDTTFRPPDWEYHFTPVFNFNSTHAEEARLLKIDPRAGRVRNEGFTGIQELFADYHLRNVSDRYDFDSIRFGIQPFSADFRGFLFQDNQLMLRLFGTRDNNRWQYNLAWIRRLEKDTNSGLNDVSRALRDDDTFLANLYRQDWPVLGYTSQVLVAHNNNREDQTRFYDNNGFLARPASFGQERLHRYQVNYLGYNGDGHFGRINLTVSAYAALGSESRGLFSNARRDIAAGFAAAEISVDQDWMRWRASALWASGDPDPYDDSANGFDAIFENPIFAGADTSFWIRQAVPLIGGGGVALSARNGVLNSLRHSKEHGQSNFTNPGTQLLGAGADFDLLPELRVSFNFNQLWFDDSAVLEAARNQGKIPRDIGLDVSTALIWRPWMSQNIVWRLSAARLLPGDGFRALFPDESPYSVLGNLTLAY